MEYIEKLPAWLRWILLPIACLAAMVLVRIAVLLFFWFQARMIGLGDDGWLSIISNTVIVGGLTGYATVQTGVMVAPSNRKIVSLIVGGLVVMLSGFSTILLLARHQWRDAVEVVATVIGVGIAIYSTFEEEEAKSRRAPLETQGHL